MSTDPHRPALSDTARASLHRVRMGVRATLTLGVAASLGANVLHAEPTIIGRTIAAWPPVALLLTIELISRVPANDRRMAWTRRATTTLIASIAAWVSYWHMVQVVANHGESPMAAHLVPLSVDGLIVVASICLAEIGDRLKPTTEHERPAAAPASAPAVEVAPPAARPVEAPAPRLAVTAKAKAKTTARRKAPDAAARIERYRAKHPDATSAEIAAGARVSDRTVRRHGNAADTAAPVAVEAPHLVPEVEEDAA